MEETSKIIGTVAKELLFFSKSFFLGFMLRFCYEPLVMIRIMIRHPKLIIDIQDIIFWLTASFLMFGHLFRENNGTPRLFAIAGILVGMIMYHAGPGKLTKKLCKRRKMEKKRLKKEKKSFMIKRQDGRSRNKRGDNIGRKDGGQKKSKSQMDYTGTCDSIDSRSDDMGCRKQLGRAKCKKSCKAAISGRTDSK